MGEKGYTALINHKSKAKPDIYFENQKDMETQQVTEADLGDIKLKDDDTFNYSNLVYCSVKFKSYKIKKITPNNRFSVFGNQYSRQHIRYDV